MRWQRKCRWTQLPVMVSEVNPLMYTTKGAYQKMAHHTTLECPPPPAPKTAHVGVVNLRLHFWGKSIVFPFYFPNRSIETEV